LARDSTVHPAAHDERSTSADRAQRERLISGSVGSGCPSFPAVC
jgi:hypothetical protein